MDSWEIKAQWRRLRVASSAQLVLNLFAPMFRHPHEIADRRSIILHERVAQLMLEDPSIQDRARQRVQQWRRSGSVAQAYTDAWEGLLSCSVPEVVAVLRRDDDEARQLRQVSPFAGVLSARERWDLLRREKAERERP
jgi:hypothetical protein